MTVLVRADKRGQETLADRNICCWRGKVKGQEAVTERNMDRNKRRYEGGRNPRETPASASAQSGRILERNAVVETRSVSVRPRRLRCRPSTTGCYRPPRSSHHAEISSSIFTEDYACLLPPLHITPPCFTFRALFSHPPALRGVFSSPFRFSLSFGPLTLLHSPRFRFRL